MKTKLDSILEELSNEFESQLNQTDNELGIHNREDIMDKIDELEEELELYGKYEVYKPVIKKQLSYYYNLADQWRE